MTPVAVAAVTAVATTVTVLRVRLRTFRLVPNTRCAMLLLGMIALDIVMAGVLIKAIFALPATPPNQPLMWIAIGGGVPALLRADRFKLRVGNAVVHPGTVYFLLRGHWEDELDGELSMWRRSQAVVLAKQMASAREKDVANTFESVVAGRRLWSAQRKRACVGKVQGALGRTNKQERLLRLAELMYDFNVRPLIRHYAAPKARWRRR